MLWVLAKVIFKGDVKAYLVALIENNCDFDPDLGSNQGLIFKSPLSGISTVMRTFSTELKTHDYYYLGYKKEKEKTD